MTKTKKGPEFYAIVDWVDPTTHNEWLSARKAAQVKATVVRSVGFLVDDGKTTGLVRIALDCADDEGYHGIGVIPIGCVTKMKKVRVQ